MSMSRSRERNSSNSSLAEMNGVNTSFNMDESSFVELAQSRKPITFLKSSLDQCTVCEKQSDMEHYHFIITDRMLLDPHIKLPHLIKAKCENCDSSIGLQRCSSCFIALYCSSKCQLVHWPIHSKQCSIEDETKALQSEVKRAREAFMSTSNGDTLDKPFHREPVASITVPSKMSVSPNAKNESNTNFCSPKVSVTVPLSSPQKSPAFQNGAQAVEKSKTPIKTETPKTESSLDALYGPEDPETILVEQLQDGEDVSVCYGRNPGHFSVQKNVNCQRILTLIKVLSDTCEKFPVEKLEKGNIGSIGACLYKQDNKWYRVQILNVIEDKCFVHFIDFGNVEKVIKNELVRLPLKFFKPPAQAISCSLSGILPEESEWSDKAIAYFAELSEGEKYKKCKIYSFDEESETYSIDLFDLHGNSIKEELIRKGFAKDEGKIKEKLASSSALDEIDFTSNITQTASVNEMEIQKPKSSTPLLPKFNEVPTSLNLDAKEFVPKKEVRTKLKSKINEIETIEDAATTTPYDFSRNLFCAIIDVDLFSKIGEVLRNQLMPNEFEIKAEIHKPKVGELVAVKGSDDDFYRAHVLELKPEGFVTVFMIDAGYLETTEFIYEMPSDLQDMPATVMIMTPNDPNIEPLEQLNTDEPIRFTGIVKSRTLEVTLIEIKFDFLEKPILMKSFDFEYASQDFPFLKSQRKEVSVKEDSTSAPVTVVNVETSKASEPSKEQTPEPLKVKTPEDYIRDLTTSKMPLNQINDVALDYEDPENEGVIYVTYEREYYFSKVEIIETYIYFYFQLKHLLKLPKNVRIL